MGAGPDVSDALTVGALLRAATVWLREQGDEEARIDVELLLARALSVDRAGVFARLGETLEPHQRLRFEESLERHARGEPIAYILGEREFFGLPFTVRPGVLIPRPETELIVEEVLGFIRQRGLPTPRILDVGTGSGAIAVAVARSVPTARVHATDIDGRAIELARENAIRHDVRERIDFQQADLLEGVVGSWDVIAGNLPYIPTDTVAHLDPSLTNWEGRLALDGGADGLAPHRRLLSQARALLATPGMVILEVADDRGEAAMSLFATALPDTDIVLLTDLFGRDRAVRAILGDREAS